MKPKLCFYCPILRHCGPSSLQMTICKRTEEAGSSRWSFATIRATPSLWFWSSEGQSSLQTTICKGTKEARSSGWSFATIPAPPPLWLLQIALYSPCRLVGWLVGWSTSPLYTKQYQVKLTQYHQVPTSTAPYWPSTTKYQLRDNVPRDKCSLQQYPSQQNPSQQSFHATIVPLDNCSSRQLFLRSFTNGHLQRGQSSGWPKSRWQLVLARDSKDVWSIFV